MNRTINRIATVLSIAFIILANSSAYAIEKYIIRQEKYSFNGILISRPKALDIQISTLIRLNNIRSLEDYAKWLEVNIKYQRDGLKNSWSTPQETLRKKRGDCEDFAFLNQAVARVMGYKPKIIALIGADFSHAICIFKQDGYYLWFDNGVLRRTGARTLHDFAKYMMGEYNYTKLSELLVFFKAKARKLKDLVSLPDNKKEDHILTSFPLARKKSIDTKSSYWKTIYKKL